MSVGLLGRKIGMTQVYTGDGILEPVTVIEAGPCVVLQVRSMERDGYDAVQLGFADKARGKATKAERGHVAALDSRRRKAGTATAPKADCEAKRWIREFRCNDASHGLKVGDVLQPSSLEGINFVDVVGVTRGRGFFGCNASAQLPWSTGKPRCQACPPQARFDRCQRRSFSRLPRYSYGGPLRC